MLSVVTNNSAEWSHLIWLQNSQISSPSCGSSDMFCPITPVLLYIVVFLMTCVCCIFRVTRPEMVYIGRTDIEDYWHSLRVTWLDRWYVLSIVHSWWRSTVVRTLFYDWQTFPGLHHDVQLTGDHLGVNRPLYVSQHGQLSHSSSWGW